MIVNDSDICKIAKNVIENTFPWTHLCTLVYLSLIDLHAQRVVSTIGLVTYIRRCLNSRS
jgi:hypothetical protein